MTNDYTGGTFLQNGTRGRGVSNALPVNVDLSAFKNYRHRLVIAGGTNANMQVTAAPLKKSDEWHHEIPPRGGFILRLDK